MSAAAVAQPRRVIEEAARWLVKVHEGAMSEQDRLALQAWRAQDREHERAWQAADSLARAMGSVPPQLGMAVLEGARRRQRRAMVKTLAVLLAAAPGGWLAWRHGGADWAAAQRADYRTATGERRAIVLEDGSRVVLNTGSALDIVYTAQRRTLILREGEIMVQTGKDAAGRDFFVQTRHGAIRALGTRFLVRREAGGESSSVAVLEHAVEVRALLAQAAAPAVRVEAGQGLRFTAEAVAAPQSLPRGAGAWVDGMLVADKMRLDDFLAELTRYRSGVIHCLPEVAALKVSGVFRIDDTGQALAALQETLPVAVRMRTRYWVTVAAAS
ncbi:FecR domain-containing protein [Herbaspirillum sp. WKF16]|uniref:FecR domain-containing protein n=1 Tax=Herbaspirillum sp. WKF16 TaxID=3028312 RepID=UPI0023A98FDB|nr:FecR domain-containing protein [Herbaspirillum sp. WKF16]WDZ94710.1 FecR domain-containing protein [Herbaspirillum sp. WKF16]